MFSGFPYPSNFAKAVTSLPEPFQYKSMKDASFAVMGPQLFNSIPSELRDPSLSLNSFKCKLDKFLAHIPDKPTMPNYHQPSRSNCIISQMEVMRREGIPI